MARRSSVSFRLSLVAVVFGLYALCMTNGARASEVEWGVVVRHADAVVLGANPMASAHLRHVSHQRIIRALPRASAPSSLFKTACVVPPNLAETVLVPENVLALGGVPRAPGPCRAPPAA
jgi:hypothetical protein